MFATKKIKWYERKRVMNMIYEESCKKIINHYLYFHHENIAEENDLLKKIQEVFSEHDYKTEVYCYDSNIREIFHRMKVEQFIRFVDTEKDYAGNVTVYYQIY